MNDDDDRVDFEVLAQHDAAFRQHLTHDAHGKPRIDWNKPEALKALTAATLHYRFQIRWDIPLGTLCPPVPNRAAYLRWIDRLLQISPRPPKAGPVRGIDIGTGASCIYPLLGTAMFGYHFLATDTNAQSLEWAQKNIASNKWEDRIATRLQSQSGDILAGLLGEGDRYDFVVCNPPFFDYAEAPEPAPPAAAGAEPPDTDPMPLAGGCGTGNPCAPRRDRTTLLQRNEHATEGGEVAFVGRMITESAQLQDRITWYTTMLGRKQSLTALRARLQADRSVSIRCTTICHGKTTRWLLGWTYCDFRPQAEAVRPPSATVEPSKAAGPAPAEAPAPTETATAKRPSEEPEAGPPAKRSMGAVARMGVDAKGVCVTEVRMGPGVSVGGLLQELRGLLADLGATQAQCGPDQLSAIVDGALLSDLSPAGSPPVKGSFKVSARVIDGRNPPVVRLGFAMHLPGTTKPMGSPPAALAELVRFLFENL